MAWTERYVRADAAGSGNGTTDTNSGANGAFTIPEAITHSTTNTNVRYNVKAGVYANTSTVLTFSGAGTGTALNWWRGFKTTIGDMDSATVDHGTFASGTEIPAITFTTGRAQFSASYQLVSNIDFDSANTDGNGSCLVSAGYVRLYRVRARNTATSGTIRALHSSSGATPFFAYNCQGVVTHTSGNAIRCGGQYATVYGCRFSGGNVTATFESTYQNMIFCTVTDSTATLVDMASDNQLFTNCTISGGTIGINVGVFNAEIANCVITNCTTGGIRSTSSTARVHIFNNSYWNNAANLVNIAESLQFNEIQEVSSPFVNSAGGDFSLVANALAKGAGHPGRLTDGSHTGYLDIGALQAQASGLGLPKLIGNNSLLG